MVCGGLLLHAEGCLHPRAWGGRALNPERCLGQVPSGLLPALEVDGQLWTESADIMSLLEVRLACMPLQDRASLCHQVRREPERLECLPCDLRS